MHLKQGQPIIIPIQALWLLELLVQEAGPSYLLLYVDDDILINPW